MSDSPLRLAIFDMDGTLIDGQWQILACMKATFEEMALPVPTDDAVRQIIGLSLPVAMAELAPDAPADLRSRMVDRYKETFVTMLAGPDGKDVVSPYPKASDHLTSLAEDETLLLGVATGKSRRGVNRVLDVLDWRHHFVTLQVADDHPSKPHPSMLMAALSETGVEPDQAVMIGDTTFDMEMAIAANITPIGVSWGYHPTDALNAAGATEVVDSFSMLADVLDAVLGR
ncbi:MAG: HAD-IA family hydrolase [Pseudomonadota bacterium]